VKAPGSLNCIDVSINVSFGTIMMSLLGRFGLAAKREQALARQVIALQSALADCRGAATRWRRVRVGRLALVAIICLGSGFVPGAVYGDPARKAITDFVQTMGFAQPDSAAGYAAYENRRYRTALRLMHPLAEKGDGRAQSIVGLMYYKGNGVAQDNHMALHWLRLAADQSDARAQFNLGSIYYEAQGVPQDSTEAIKWWRLAADQGYPPAQYNLGLWYAGGKGGSPDNIRALMWLNLAAARFLTSGGRQRLEAVKSRNVVASRMTPGQIEEAQKLAREWKPTPQ
jgi:hypothetical protein